MQCPHVLHHLSSRYKLEKFLFWEQGGGQSYLAELRVLFFVLPPVLEAQGVYFPTKVLSLLLKIFTPLKSLPGCKR